MIPCFGPAVWKWLQNEQYSTMRIVPKRSVSIPRESMTGAQTSNHTALGVTILFTLPLFVIIVKPPFGMILQVI